MLGVIMVSSLSGVLRTAKRYGDYGANFLLGTGADRIGKEIGMAVKGRARKAVGMSIPQAIGAGVKKGIARNHAELAKNGGFLRNLWANIKNTPSAMGKGWSEGAGIFSKIGKAVKPLGKLMPFIMNALWLAQSIPDIVARTKDEGIWGGIKEAGKAVVKMGVFSVSAAVGSTFGIAGMLALPIAAGMVTDMIVGKSYGEKKAEAEAEKEQAQQQQNPFAQQSKVGQKLDITSAA